MRHEFRTIKLKRTENPLKLMLGIAMLANDSIILIMLLKASTPAREAVKCASHHVLTETTSVFKVCNRTLGMF